ncbi:hypothetical protein RJ640_007737 [Escallonia rubra]|uniref:DYW domain-containing protein n=1 Tax=Escallonia rubra TaxID=112253 RepID=A0AA88U593_9ASTE|nr:hypothetical protein RJ640_007737 [Escallonia rubra]
MDAISSSMHMQQFPGNPKKPFTITTQVRNTYFNLLTHAVKPGRSAHALQLLDEMPKTSDTLAWNTLIQTHVRNSDFDSAVATYWQMLLRGIRPDRHTLPRILSVSRVNGSLSFGKQLHGHAVKLRLCSDQYVTSALIEMYGKLDGADAAKWVLDKSCQKSNSVSWTLLCGLYLKENKPRLAIGLFNEMLAFGVEIDKVALVTVIGACGALKSLQEGRNVHQAARRCGLEFDVLVSNALLNMYVDCGSMKDARGVFDQMPLKDAISWTAMVRGYVKKGEFNEGLKLFRQMNAEGIKPDAVAIASVLPACARMAAHKNGKEIHGFLLRNGIDMNLRVQNALIDMYVKSGFIEYASQIFSRMKDKDVISWTVMILGYSLHGQGEVGVNLFRNMAEKSEIEIDEITYVTVLYACCSALMVEDGWLYFDKIRSPQVAHCALMVALLGRAGLFDEARAFIEERQLARHAEVLRALLDGCRIHQNVNTGKRLVEQLCDLEPLNADNFVLLSNWYAHMANWDMVEKSRETIEDMGLRPKKACSWIEFKNKVHVYGTGDVSHPRSERIYWELRSLMEKVEGEGIMTSSDFSLHDVDEERECIPIGHSELLALSFGLISTQAGATIRVTKNLRICRNCHDFVKVISKVVEREIIIKDPSCFHHFKDGSCSCRDL